MRRSKSRPIATEKILDMEPAKHNAPFQTAVLKQGSDVMPTIWPSERRNPIRGDKVMAAKILNCVNTHNDSIGGSLSFRSRPAPEHKIALWTLTNGGIGCAGK